MDPALGYVAKLGVHPDLAERLHEIGAEVGVEARQIGGGAALVHENGVVFGLATGTSGLALRLPPEVHAEAVLAPGSSQPDIGRARELTLELEDALGPDWVAVDPWPLELRANEGLEQLRRWCRAAHEHVATLASWPPP